MSEINEKHVKILKRAALLFAKTDERVRDYVSTDESLIEAVETGEITVEQANSILNFYCVEMEK